ncbi:MAG: hypothetical protein N4A35_12955 [Flavobacteriales bacterium]|jgi:DNA-nicking Smr family endonuclease|nr:hypothetical protein [Flavobacteriales bacterium]
MKKGSKVRFLNEVGGGVVVNVISNFKVLVEDENGFDIECFIKDLVEEKNTKDYKLDGIEHNLAVQEKVASESKEKQLEDFYQKTKSLNRIETPEEIEVDLHIEELIETHKGMSNSQILEVQMANFRRELNVAIRKKVKRLIIIHGVGEGTLKAAIRNELYESYPSIEHHDASYRKYGYGATEILVYTYH